MAGTLVGMLLVAALAVGWVAVQRAWARAFPDAFDDPDVLAGRAGCHGCGCTTPCPRRARRDPEETP